MGLLNDLGQPFQAAPRCGGNRGCPLSPIQR